MGLPTKPAEEWQKDIIDWCLEFGGHLLGCIEQGHGYGYDERLKPLYEHMLECVERVANSVKDEGPARVMGMMKAETDLYDLCDAGEEPGLGIALFHRLREANQDFFPEWDTAEAA